MQNIYVFVYYSFIGLFVTGCSEAFLQSDHEQIASEVETRIMDNLHNSDWLQQEIAKGIADYERKKNKAKQLARAKQEQQKAEKAKSVKAPDKTVDHIYGNPDAEVSLIEYSDFKCPYCKKFHPTLHQVIDKYNGRVNWVYRHFPLSFHNPEATKIASASECANELGGNDHFWKYADAVYLQPKDSKGSFSINQLVAIAEKTGLNAKQFKDCINNTQSVSRVSSDVKEGQQIGVTGTPATIIRNNTTGNVVVKNGAVPFTAIVEAIDKVFDKPR